MQGILFVGICVTFFSSPVLSQFSYGPSIYSLTRAEGKNDSSINLKKTSGRTLYLSNYAPTFSVLLPLVDGKPFVSESEAVTYFKSLHHGEFYVVAPEGWGISAVIQILRLATVFGNSSKCLDYIQFREEVSKENQTSPRICGTIEPENLKKHTAKLKGPRSFVTQNSKLTVEIFIFSSGIRSEWTIQGSRLEKTITAEISFTAFPLPPSEDTDEIPNKNITCSQFESRFESFNLTSGSFEPCQVYSQESTKEEFCIHERLFCDSIIHCPFNHTNLWHASDEKINCTHVLAPVEIEPEDEKLNHTERRLIPKSSPKVQSFEVQVAHWSIICIGGIIFLVILTVLGNFLSRKNFWRRDAEIGF